MSQFRNKEVHLFKHAQSKISKTILCFSKTIFLLPTFLTIWFSFQKCFFNCTVGIRWKIMCHSNFAADNQTWSSSHLNSLTKRNFNQIFNGFTDLGNRRQKPLWQSQIIVPKKTTLLDLCNFLLIKISNNFLRSRFCMHE